MTLSAKTGRSNAAAPERLFAVGALSLAWPLVALAYLFAYVGLDWASYIYPFAAFGITPWNPSAGVSFALVLIFGRQYLPLLFIAVLLADLLVRGWPLTTRLELGVAGVTAAVYASTLILLSKPALRFDAELATVRDVLALLVAAVASAAVVAIATVGLLTGAGMLPSSAFTSAALRFWVGDVIGIAIITPFLLMLATGRLTIQPHLETAGQILAILAVVGIVFAFPASPNLQLFYLLFLPIIWVALRSGLERVTLGLVITQVALIVGLEFTGQKAGAVTAFQILLLVLTVTGLTMGSVVTERRRAADQLRHQQEALAKVARIGSMGVLGAAIAHEINQPLSAIATYTELVRRHLVSGSPDKAIALETATKAIGQVGRVADIVQKLRDLIRLGQVEAGPYTLQQIKDETMELARADLERNGATLEMMLPMGLPSIMVDRVQIEQVLMNLIRNALDAMALNGQNRKLIVIEAAARPGALVEIAVRDSGPGFPGDRIEVGLVPSTSDKVDGLGLGLILCRTIVESHGGQLWIDHGGSGGIVRFNLKAADGAQSGRQS